MRIGLPTNSERYGSNLFYGVQKVYELDGGLETDQLFGSPFHVIRQIPLTAISEIEKEMAIVIPIRNEKLRLLEGVLTGVPHHCFPIIISNSTRYPTDRFQMEKSLLHNYCHAAKKRYLCLHQRSVELADLFRMGEYHQLLDEDGLVKNGKAEGMIAGIVLAKLLKKKYVGFIDADNYFPGSVLEYIRLFSSGFWQSNTGNAMVRIQWHSKPKIKDQEMFFSRFGRVSRITNQVLNQLLGLHSDFETDIILTGNAGEHAITMDLALSLNYYSGFAVETGHFISLLERYGGIHPSPHPAIMAAGIEVFQMQSRNPHFHDFQKGEDHLKEMIGESLAVIYHSAICPEGLKQDIVQTLEKYGIPNTLEKSSSVNTYPSLDLFRFDEVFPTVPWQVIGNYQP